MDSKGSAPPQNVALYNQLIGPRYKLSYRREEERTSKYMYDMKVVICGKYINLIRITKI